MCISRDDRLTEGTAVQVEANNLGRGKICPMKPGEDPCGKMRAAPVKKKPTATVAAAS